MHPDGRRAPLRRQLIRPAPGGCWQVSCVGATGSTNADLAAVAASGAPDRSVLVADLQTAGRGRMGRSWQAPAGAALTFSVLLRPAAVPPARRGWIGGLLGLAVLDGIDRCSGLAAQLKWPNDVLIAGRKVAGVLAELTGSGALVAGAGVNVDLVPAELPRPDATSLAIAGADPAMLGREILLTAVLDALAGLLDRWESAAGDMESAGLLALYRRHCGTLGSSVRIELPDGTSRSGVAVDVTADGAIVIDDGTGPARFAAGDVIHLRTVPAASRGLPDRARHRPGHPADR